MTELIELSKTERDNLNWLWSVLSEREGKYTTEFKEYAYNNITKFEKNRKV